MNLYESIEKLFGEGYSEGELAIHPLWYILWPTDEIDELNVEYGIKEYAPEFTAFGSNGGNELLVVDAKGKVYMLPAIGMSLESAELIAESIDALKRHMEKDS